MDTSLSTFNYRFIFLLKSFCIALLTLSLLAACGGGSSSSDDDSNLFSDINNLAPTALAGADRTVDEQTEVQLRADGTDNDGQVVSGVWSQISGIDVGLPTIDINSTIPLNTNIQFVSPVVTGVGASELLVFELTVRDDDGATATDQLTITVNAVNASPTVDAGADQAVDEGLTVALQGMASDTDGTIVSYLWEQISGVNSVDLVNADQAMASFVASAVADRELFTFSLTVTDNEGATQSDVVAIEILDINTPDLSIHFPSATGRYSGADIDVFGTASAKGNAVIDNVSITTDTTSVDAVVDIDGAWRAVDVPLPTGVTSSVLTVVVTDSDGLTRSSTIDLITTGTAGSGNAMQDEVRGLALDTDNNQVYVMTSNITFFEADKVHIIDLNTGARDDSLYNNVESNGVRTLYPAGLALDRANDRLLISDSVLEAIVAADINTGQRQIIADDSVGVGTNFGFIGGAAMDTLNGLLYVVDNTENRVFEVDIDTGNRVVVADASSANQPVSFPIGVAYDSINVQLVVTENLSGSTPLLAVDLSQDPAITRYLSQTDVNNGPDLTNGIFGVVVDATGSTVYLLVEDELLAVDMSTGDRELVTTTDFLFSSSTKLNDMVYDTQHQVIYAAGKPNGNSTNVLLVIDPESGDVVTLSE